MRIHKTVPSSNWISTLFALILKQNVTMHYDYNETVWTKNTRNFLFYTTKFSQNFRTKGVMCSQIINITILCVTMSVKIVCSITLFCHYFLHGSKWKKQAFSNHFNNTILNHIQTYLYQTKSGTLRKGKNKLT